MGVYLRSLTIFDRPFPARLERRDCGGEVLDLYVGAALSTVMPMEPIEKVAGGASVVIGVLMLADKL